jgi:peptidoglycan/xylan/chitin deacetylase (PgdA/CDA1 family)
MRKLALFYFFLVFCLGIVGCEAGFPNETKTSPLEILTLTPVPEIRTTKPITLPPLPGLPIYSPTPVATLTASYTQVPTSTTTPVPNRVFNPSLTPSATWVFNQPGKIVAPILLYHHFTDEEPPNRYYVSVKTFQQQIELLHNLGYQSITPSQLVSVLLNGGELPVHPVVITFDDGNLDVYQYAFPVMQKYGYVGAVYIVANRLASDGFLHIDQLKDMLAAGWEIGSHSMSHPNLIQDYTTLKTELLNSRLLLERNLDVSVTSFAYPYGLVDDYILGLMRENGYTNGMGIGIKNEQSVNARFYLNRHVVERSLDLVGFLALLPWQGNPTPMIP